MNENHAGSATGIDLAALTAIQDRLALAYRLCLSLAPKQAVGELLETATNMPEWEEVRAALARATPQHPDLATLREAFDAEGPNYQISVERYKQRPDDYKFEQAKQLWQFVQAVVRRATPQHSVTEPTREFPPLPETTLEAKVAGYSVKVYGVQHMRDYARAYAAQPLASTAATQPEQDAMWDKAIEAEAIANQLKQEKADLLAALRAVVESPSRCVAIAEAALHTNE